GGGVGVGTPFVPTGCNGYGAQERSRDETACGGRVSARPLTAPSTVAIPQPDSERSSNGVGNFTPAHLGSFRPALTTRPGIDSNDGILPFEGPMERFVSCFAELEDPREDNVRHDLHEILV